MDDLTKLIKELTHHDPHHRQNAVRFLSQKFLDDTTRNSMKEEDKAKIVTGLLSRLETGEDSLEVKGCTVKTFANISKHLKENEIIQIFSKIITYITDSKAIGKDIYVTCIKAILKEMSGSSCYTVGKIIIPEITKGIQSNSAEIKELCFDTFNDYIDTFNYVLIKESESVIKNKDAIVGIAVDTIHIDNQTLRKTVSSFLGNFSVILNKVQMGTLLAQLISRTKDTTIIHEKIAFLTALNSVAKNTASRHVEYLKNILEIILDFSNKQYLENNMQDYDLNNDLVEAGLNLLETYILKLTNQMKPYSEKIANAVLELMEFDPNHIYSDSGDQTGGNNYDEYGYNEYEGYEDYGALVYADDSSWKVRRAAVRVIQSFIKSRLEIKRSTLEVIIQALVFNLREHEENTKLDIISCLSAFLRSLIIDDQESEQIHHDELTFAKQTSFAPQIIPHIAKPLIEKVINDLKGNNQKFKLAVLQLLASMSLVGANEILEQFDALKPNLETCLKDNVSALTFFVFMSRLLKTSKHSSDVARFFEDYIKWIVMGLKHDYYKINIESLNMAFHLIRVLVENLSPQEYQKPLENLYLEFLPKFKSNDVDQELKLTLVSTIGNLLLHMGHHLSQKNVEELYSIYLDKCRNENLRPLVFNWQIKIIKNNPQLKIEGALSQFAPLLLELLVKHSIHIQYQSLEFLNTIVQHCPGAIQGLENKFIEVLLSIINEESLIPLIYEVLNSIYKSYKIDADINERTLIKTVSLLEVSKQTLNNLTHLFNFIELSAGRMDKEKVAEYVKKEFEFTSLNFNKARCAAILAESSGIEHALIKSCYEKLSSNLDDNSKKNILILLGEACLKCKESHAGLLDGLEKMVASSNEELKVAIAICIGKVGVADPKQFSDKITTLSKSRETLSHYLLAIREFLQVISEGFHRNEVDSNYLNSLFSTLVPNAKDKDERIRILCGECLGLIALQAEESLKEFSKHLQDSDNIARSTFYYGLKFIFNNKFNLQNYLETLLDLLVRGLADKDLEVKVNAFNSLITFAHNFAYFIKTRYQDIWKIFKTEHIIDTTLVEVVDIGGGMKIRNDKALPIRKAIYTTIKILLDAIPEKVNVQEGLEMCLYGLDDHEDIQALSHGCLLKIANFAPETFISILDNLVDNFKARIAKTAKVTGTNKLDVKKLTDIYLNIKRLFDEIKKVQEIDENPKFIELRNEVQAQVEKIK
jgi:cullin-associated NEDD8-dissociated protein 1